MKYNSKSGPRWAVLFCIPGGTETFHRRPITGEMTLIVNGAREERCDIARRFTRCTHICSKASMCLHVCVRCTGGGESHERRPQPCLNSSFERQLTSPMPTMDVCSQAKNVIWHPTDSCIVFMRSNEVHPRPLAGVVRVKISMCVG